MLHEICLILVIVVKIKIKININPNSMINMIIFRTSLQHYYLYFHILEIPIIILQ